MERNIQFLLGQIPDAQGMMVHEYHAFSGDDWEFRHDVIQMAFPTKTQSMFQPDQPFLSEDFTIDSLTSEQLQRCRATISLLLYGYLKSLRIEFLVNRDRIHLKNLNPYASWANSSNHNTLRMTRILECLGIFEMKDIQTALYDFLVYHIAFESNGAISSKTVAFWSAARENKLHLLR